MKPSLNLATAPLENKRRFFAMSLGAGLPALLIFGILLGAAYSDWRSTRDRRAEVARLNADLNQYLTRRDELEKSFASPETKRLLDRAAFLNGLIEQRSFPWTRMFTDLEHELPAGVHVVNLSPQLKAGAVEVHMAVGASSDKGKLEFLRTLEKSTRFSRVQVLSETRPQKQLGSTDEVQLDLIARYAATESDEGARSDAADPPASAAEQAPKSSGATAGKSGHKSPAKAEVKALAARPLRPQ